MKPTNIDSHFVQCGVPNNLHVKQQAQKSTKILLVFSVSMQPNDLVQQIQIVCYTKTRCCNSI